MDGVGAVEVEESCSSRGSTLHSRWFEEGEGVSQVSESVSRPGPVPARAKGRSQHEQMTKQVAQGVALFWVQCALCVSLKPHY